MVESSFFVILLVLLLIAGCGRQGVQDLSSPAITVRTKPVRQQPIAETVSALGTCEALLDKTANIAPVIEGQVLEILIKHGQRVKAGQAIVQLNPKLADANLKEKFSQRDGLKASLKLLNSLPRDEEQNSYRLVIEEAKIALQKADAVVQRLRPLREHGDIPQQQLFEAELAAKQAQLELLKAENQLDVLMLGPRSEAVNEAEAHITSAEAGVAIVQTQRDLLTLRSPIDGVADRIACKLGQTLAAGTTICDVVDTRQLNVLIWLPVPEAAKISVGLPAEVYSADSSQGKNEYSAIETVHGKVISVGQGADAQTGNLPVRISIDNLRSRFVLGQIVTAAITVREKPDALAVPVEAIDDLGSGPQLNVIRGGKTVVLLPSLGSKDKGWVEVEGTDLKPGESVIVEGGYNLPEGTKVSLEKASKGEDQNTTKPHAGAEVAP